ncbi:hypothetical protein ABG067_006437 [Albugo candida]
MFTKISTPSILTAGIAISYISMAYGTEQIAASLPFDNCKDSTSIDKGDKQRIGHPTLGTDPGAFAQAFFDGGKKWTLSLCQGTEISTDLKHDSKWINGLYLCDPCCLIEKAEKGVIEFNLETPYTSYKCSNNSSSGSTNPPKNPASQNEPGPVTGAPGTGPEAGTGTPNTGTPTTGTPTTGTPTTGTPTTGTPTTGTPTTGTPAGGSPSGTPPGSKCAAKTRRRLTTFED